MANWNINDLVNGDNLLLYLTSGKTVLAFATSCSVQVDAETIDVSSKFSCRWANNLNGRASYTISADALYVSNAGDGMSFDGLLDLMLAGDAVDWYIGEEQDFDGDCDANPHTLDTAKPFYTGKAVVTSVSLEAGNNEIASCSITLTGAGEITKKTA